MLAANPFVNAYLQSDWFGKGIFWLLFVLSIVCWVLLLYKIAQFSKVRTISRDFARQFSEKKEQPLHFQIVPTHTGSFPHPFFEVYKTAKQYALQVMNRSSSLSSQDLDLIASQTIFTASSQCKSLENNLFMLSTIAALGPFLGLLGTVWGILLSLSQMPRGTVSNTAMLSGLSMALATTVIGLLIAIPALIGYNYLKNASREYNRELDHFTHLLLAAIELQHRTR